MWNENSLHHEKFQLMLFEMLLQIVSEIEKKTLNESLENFSRFFMKIVNLCFLKQFENIWTG